MTGPVWRRPPVAPVYAAVLAFAVVAGVSLVAEKAPAPTQTPGTSEISQTPPSGPTGTSRPPAPPAKGDPQPSAEPPSGGATSGADSESDPQ
jgi:hypothetical protein